MVSTIEDVRKEALVLYRMQHTFTHIGFIEKIVSIAENYANSKLSEKDEQIKAIERDFSQYHSDSQKRIL